MTIAVAAMPKSLIRWHHLWWALVALATMVAVIAIGNLWLLDFMHVFSGLLWTGIDLFMGFVLGPILRRVDIAARAAVAQRLTPRTLFLMPTLSIMAGTTGWFLAVRLGYTALDWPAFGWIAAALVLVTLMTVQGVGILLPVNVRVCLELQKPSADLGRVKALMQWYFYAVAMQGVMQIAIIVVMARIRTGI